MSRVLISPVLRAEWTKLRTITGPAWLLVAAVGLTVGISIAAEVATSCPARVTCPVDPVKLSLTGIQLGQAIVAILAVLVVGNEYSTGLIRLTLAAMPKRTQVLGAKAAIVTVLVLAVAVVAVAGSVLAGHLILPGHGFTAARGFLVPSLSGGPSLRAAIGAMLYLGLIALMALGITAILRDNAAAIGTVLGVLYLTPIIAAFVSNPHWHDRIERYSPANAGQAIFSATGLKDLPISPWAGLGVLTIWTAVALLAGGLVLRLRDA
jgi:ABC-2 type transport system permease protein